MVRKRPRRAAIVLCIFVTAFVAAWFLLNPRRHDPYPFLKDHPLLGVGVLGPGTWEPSELRAYSWKEPYALVASRAAADLAKAGLRRRRFGKKAMSTVEWTSELYGNGLEGMYADLMIDIIPGRFAELRSTKSPADADPQWTTVIVSSRLEETWVNVVRYTCFPMPD